MRSLRRRSRSHGQSMLEYALISATVVAGFAVALQLGFSDVFIHKMDDASQVWNIEIPTNFNNAADLVQKMGISISDFNRYISLR